MKICIAIVCCALGVTACKSDKSDSTTKTEPPKPTTTTVEPAGSAAPTPPPADPHAGHQGSGSAAPAAAGNGPDCASEFDHGKAPDKHAACVECEKHRGMGTMEAECKNAIAKPWK
jgi:hypothetical protein